MENKLSTEKITEKEILAGKFRECYLGYNRKSTDEPDNQKNSITYQKGESVRYAEKEALPIAPLTLKGFCRDGVISERHSAFHADDEITITADGRVQYAIERPKFQQLARYLSKGLFKGVIFLCWDRASRNDGDETVIKKLMQRGVDMRFVWANYDKTSAGELHKDVDGMFSIHHSRVTSEKVTKTTRDLRSRGVVTYKAPIGYLNLGSMYEKPFDLNRAPIIKKCFELYSTGDWSLSDIARWVNEQGLTTVAMRRRRTEDEMLDDDDDVQIQIPQVSRPIQRTHLQKILSNLFYTGRMIDSDGNWIKSISHEALVSDALYERCQAVRKKLKVSIYYDKKLDLRFRGLCRCADCLRAYTPYSQKGNTYLGSQCRKGCPNGNKNFPLLFVEKRVGELISKLTFTDAELSELDSRIRTDIAAFEEKRKSEIEENERRKKKIREDQEYLRLNKLSLLKSGVYGPEGLHQEENRLNAELVSLQVKEQVSDASMHEMVKDVIKLSELLKDVALLYDLGNSHEKEQIARIIFSELLISGNMLRHKCKNGFQALDSRFVAVCGHERTRTSKDCSIRF